MAATRGEIAAVVRTELFAGMVAEDLAKLGYRAHVVDTYAAAAAIAGAVAYLVLDDSVLASRQPPGRPAFVLWRRAPDTLRLQVFRSLGFAGVVEFPAGLAKLPTLLEDPSLRATGVTAELAALPPLPPPPSLAPLQTGGVKEARRALGEHLSYKRQIGLPLSPIEVVLASVSQTDALMCLYDGFEKLHAACNGSLAALVKDVRDVGAIEQAAWLEEAHALVGNVHPDDDPDHWEAHREALLAIGERWQEASATVDAALVAFARERIADLQG